LSALIDFQLKIKKVKKGIIIMRKFIILLVIICAAATAAFSQETSKNVNPPSKAQKAFENLKALSGSWEGTIMGIPISFTIRAASSGTTILQEANTTKGPTPDHEITMFYLDGERLLATHFCDAGNRSNMEGKISDDGKSVEFSFIDVAGSTKGGMIKRIMITLIDANKHLEEFTFMMPNGKPVELRGEFQRTK
jgi:hypothetical protein